MGASLEESRDAECSRAIKNPARGGIDDQVVNEASDCSAIIAREHDHRQTIPKTESRAIPSGRFHT